jgi:hypothetical protein
MRQYLIDQLSREERANIESYLKRTLKQGVMDGVFWMELEPEVLSSDQHEHEECGPYFFAVELAEESVCFELLVRSQSNLHCSCIAYATAEQRDFVLRYIDSMLEEERISA